MSHAKLDACVLFSINGDFLWADCILLGPGFIDLLIISHFFVREIFLFSKILDLTILTN